MLRATRGLVLVGGAALLLLVTGLVVFSTGPGPASFGWFADAPLSPGTVQLPWAVVWTRREAVGAGLVVLGLLAACGVAGYGIGRRHAGRRP